MRFLVPILLLASAAGCNSAKADDADEVIWFQIPSRLAADAQAATKYCADRGQEAAFKSVHTQIGSFFFRCVAKDAGY